jgi:copper chaperone NosL
MKRIAIVLSLVVSVAAVAFAGERAPVTPSPRDKCPVCGMFVKKYPDWTSQIIFKDGSYALFDGAKDMFKYYVALRKYNPSHTQMDIDSVYVIDYYSLGPIDGFNASYVIGSDVYGPMGRELIPFAKTDDANEFMKDHKGKALLKFKDITAEMLKGLD